jgi:hypothetical protein
MRGGYFVRPQTGRTPGQQKNAMGRGRGGTLGLGQRLCLWRWLWGGTPQRPLGSAFGVVPAPSFDKVQREMYCVGHESPGWSAARFNVKNLKSLRYSVTLLRPIKFDPDPAPPYRHRVLGGKIKVFEQIYSRSSVVTSGDRSSAGRVPARVPAPGTTQHVPSMMLPCSPVPLEPSTAIVLKKKSVRRTVRDEPGRRHRIPLHK